MNENSYTKPDIVCATEYEPMMQPRYSEIATFMRAPLANSLDDVDIGLIGVPTDLGVTNRPGARHGPREIRNSSSLMRSFNFRPPDIGHRENVRFPCISGSGSGGRGRGAAMGRRAGEGEADARWRANREAHAQARAREDRRRLIEELAQCLRGARSMRRAERCQRDVQLAVADADVAGGGEQLMQERASLLFGTGVVRPQQREQIALGLIGDHLDDVRQVFALGGEFDHSTLTEVSDLDALGNVAAFVDEPGQAVTCGAQLLAEFAVGDLEAAHRGAALLGVVGRGGAVVAFDLGEFDAGGTDLLVQRTALGVGNRTGRIFRFDPIVHERIEQELFAHVLEEVLLSPAIEHAVGHLDVTQIRSIRDHLGLMAVVAQACDLPQAQLALEEADRLVVQIVAHPAPIELGAAVDEAPLVDETALALAIGEDVKAVLDHRVEQLRAPATAIEDDGRAPRADHSAHLSKQMG